MGCFNTTSFVSNLQLTYGTPIVALICIKTNEKYVRNIYSTDVFKPLFLPLKGEYNDYGSIENIERDANVTFIEEYFGNNIDKIVSIIDDYNEGRHNYEKELLNFKNIEVIKDCAILLEHRSTFDYMGKYQEEPIEKIIYPYQYLLENYFNLENVDLKLDSRYKFTYKIPNNDDKYILSDGTYVNEYDIKKEVMTPLRLYCLEDFITYFKNNIGDNTYDFTKIDNLKSNVSFSEFLYNVYVESVTSNKNFKLTLLSNEGVADIIRKYTTEDKIINDVILVDDLLTIIKNDSFKDEVKNTLGENEYDSFMKDFIFLSNLFHKQRTYKGVYLSSLLSDSSYENIALERHYPKEVLIDPSLKQLIIEMQNFNINMNKNSLVYRYSTYSSQTVDFNFFKGFFEMCLNTTNEKIKNKEDY